MNTIRFKPYFPILLLPVWVALYMNLDYLANYTIKNILSMQSVSPIREALLFFIYEVPKVLLLLTLIVFGVGILRSYFSPEKTRKALEGKPLFLGNVLASSLGIVTPFCSCSAVPLFLGFVEAGIPLGVTFSFLIAAPMINEVAVILLFGLFGWQTTLIYVGTGLVIAISAGWIIGKLKLERFVQPWVFESRFGTPGITDEKLQFKDRIAYGVTAVKEIVSKVWIYMVVGIAVGAFIHGYVPENFMAGIMGKYQWWSVPVTVLIGIPLYSNAAGIIPIVQSLMEKGASLGTALAFMMSVIGLSLPEAIILKKVLRLPLLFIFYSIVGAGIIAVGYIFNLIY